MGRRKKISHKDISEELKKCFPDEEYLDDLRVCVRSYAPELRMSERWIHKNVYTPYNRMLVDFYIRLYPEEDEEKEVNIARMDLRTANFDDVEELLVDSDEDADFGSSASTLVDYIQNFREYDYEWVEDANDKIVLCELHTFYISPEYRGKGLSKYFLAAIPTLLDMICGIKSAGVVATINPFLHQGSLNSKRKFKSNGYQHEKKNPKLVEQIDRSLTSAGFKKISEKLEYATDLYELKRIALEKGIDFWEGHYAG